jgi:Phage tail assembly chaperone protein
MENLDVNGLFTHNLMTIVLMQLYPDLRPGRDFMTAHLLSQVTGEQDGDPFIVKWAATGIAQPDDADIKAEFEKNEAIYRAIFARLYRDSWLAATDGLANATDAPPDSKAGRNATLFRTYRQALRDIPQQSGFPLDIDWPDYPG